jgi:hypothetical protein
MKKQASKKLTLSTETLRALPPQDLGELVGGQTTAITCGCSLLHCTTAPTCGGDSAQVCTTGPTCG